MDEGRRRPHLELFKITDPPTVALPPSQRLPH